MGIGWSVGQQNAPLTSGAFFFWVGIKQEIKMRTKIFFLGFVTTCFVASAYLTIIPFPGWDTITESAPDIIIAQCTKTPDPFNEKTNGIGIDMRDGLIYSDIRILSVLKGATNMVTARLYSEYRPRQGEYYLILSDYQNGFYQACEKYRIIPLGLDFSTNSIAGKPLDDQLQILFKRRIDDLNLEIQNDETEKQRLEDGIKNNH